MGPPHRDFNPGRRRPLRWLARGVVVGITLVLALASVIAVRIVLRVDDSLHPPRQRVGKPVGLRGAIPVALRTHDGLTIRGWYVPSTNGAAVILAHGISAEREQVLPEAQALAGQGFGVELFDWRDHGESDGSHTTWGIEESKDMEAVLDDVSRRPDVHAASVGAYGFSMGAAVVTRVAAHDERLRAIALAGATTSLADGAAYDERNWGAFSRGVAVWAFRHLGVNPDSLRTADDICRVAPRPVAIAVGDQDIQLPPGSGPRLLAAACGPKSLWVIKGAKHGLYGPADNGELGRRLVGFFSRALLPPIILMSHARGRSRVRRSGTRTGEAGDRSRAASGRSRVLTQTKPLFD